MDERLKDEVALVTGASRGIGKSIAIALAEAGVHVVLTARSEDLLEEVKAGIKKSGDRATVIAADLSNEGDITALFENIRSNTGKLDILVNNAGLLKSGKLVEFPMEEFDIMFAVNLKAVYACCQQALKIMIPAGSGYIINISSVVGFKGYPNQTAYTATKHGVMGLTKALAAEVQENGIRVSAILPGGVDTDLIGSVRPDLDPSILIRPEDIARTVLYLLSLSDKAMVDQIYVRRRSGSPF